jgi:hypothetical protein
MQIDTLFSEMLNTPELTSWVSDLSRREHDDAVRLFRKAVREAIDIHDRERYSQIKQL